MAIQAQFFPSNGGGSPFCDNGYYPGGLSESFFNSQQKQHHQQQQLQHCLQQSYNESQRIVDPNLLLHNSKPLNYSPNFALQLDEIDQYIRLQNEELRFMLQELGKQQVAALLNRVKSHSLKILREKDEEIAQATKKRVELEEFLRSLEAENQAWQKMAHESEAAALSLYKTLEEMKEKASNNNGVVANDEESWCDIGRRREEGIGENNNNNNRVGVGGEFEEIITREMMVCKSCNSGRSCIMFLPCRHLCSCKACGAFLKACPVCRMPKKASIETLIF